MFYLQLALPLSISRQFQMVCEISYCTNRPPLFFKSWHLTYKTFSFITFLTLPIQTNVLLRSLRANPCKNRPKSPISGKAQKSQSLVLCILVDFSKYTNVTQFFERSVCFREKRRKPFQAAPSISKAKRRVEIHHDSLDWRSNTTTLGKKGIAKNLSITLR